MNKRRLAYNMQYALMHGLYWLGFCACVAFAAVYMQYRGYSNSLIGVTLALGNIMGVALSTWLATLTDRLGRKCLVTSLAALVVLQLGLQLMFTAVRGQSALILIGYCLYSALVNAGGGLLNQVCTELERECGHVNFGAARGTGSLFYSMGAMTIGALLERLTPNALPMIAGCGMIGQLVLLGVLALILRRGTSAACAAQQPPASGLVEFFRANKRYTLLMLGTVLVYFSHNSLTNYFINVVRNVGGTTADMGRINGFMALVEIPVMLLYDRISRRLSSPRAMRIASIGFVAKGLAFALAPSVTAMYAACLFEMCSFAVITPASVRYCEEYVAPQDAAKGQTVAFAATTLASVLAASISGVLYDNLPVRTVLLIAAVVSAVGAAICLVFATPDRAPNN